MLLSVDIGNTDVVCGVYSDSCWQQVWRLRSLVGEGVGHYEARLRLYFLESGISTGAIETVVLSSVVPGLTPTIQRVLYNLLHQEPILVNSEVFPALKIKIDRPHELGADLIANSVAAFTKYRRNCMIVDFGTALTFTTVSAEGAVLGVAIVPGLATAVKSLFVNTAQLPEVPLQLPASAIGKNTVHSIQAGILLGYDGLVKSLIARIRSELGGDCIAVATGGLSSIIETLKDEFVEIDPYLTLDGLRIIGETVAGS